MGLYFAPAYDVGYVIMICVRTSGSIASSTGGSHAIIGAGIPHMHALVSFWSTGCLLILYKSPRAARH